MIAIDGTVLIDDAYAEYAVYVVAGGDSSLGNDFPITAIEGTVSLTNDPGTDAWRVLVAAFDSASPSGDPQYFSLQYTASGTTSYPYLLFLNTDAFPDDAYILSVVRDESEVDQDSGAYGSNPLSVSGGSTRSNINITTSP
ncbi:MAG: hypothetical protein ACLFR1_14625 [Spirochaetia bacterium]